MSTFKPTWLYIKQHKLTGLKYFGKTTKKNPENYLGSGLHWQRHLKVYGKDVNTIWAKFFENKEELIEFAIDFSLKNNIIESTEWANVKIENGLDGGSQKGRTLSESCRQKLSTAGKKRTHSESTKDKMSLAKQGVKRKPFSQEWKNNLSVNHRSKHGYTATVSEETKKKISDTLSGPIYCVTTNTTYPSRQAAAEELNLKVQNIHAVVAGYQKSTGGYVFAKL